MTLQEASILLVDDEPMLLEIYSLWFRLLGCPAVLTAGSGEAALQVLRGQRVDLTISDLRMPGMDGLALARRAAELGGTRVLFVSGFGEVDRREMYALGVRGFLLKPLTRMELIEAATTALRPPDEQWLRPMDEPPRQSIDLALETPLHAHLGQGGFSVRPVGPLLLGKIVFRCRFPRDGHGGDRELTGQGYVRWHAKTDRAAGIEFHYLEPECRAWVLEEIDANAPHGFLPSLQRQGPERLLLSIA